MKLNISTLSQTPIYQQIYNQIKNDILNNQLNPYEPLPSIRSLSRELKIGIITVKRAYEDLAKDGYIISKSGVGYFVSEFDVETIKSLKFNLVKEQFENAFTCAIDNGLNMKDIKQILNGLIHTQKK